MSKEICAVLPDLTLKTEDAQPLLDEIVQPSKLMLAMDGGTRYQVTRLTLQEQCPELQGLLFCTLLVGR